jgi:sulfate/thiosulfate transport system substrate-binding protein
MSTAQKSDRASFSRWNDFFGRLNYFGKKFISFMAVGLLLSLSIAACSNGNPASDKVGGTNSIELTLVGYAVPKPAHDAIIPKFVEKWKKEHNGQTITFRQSYGGSGSQTRAIIDGLEADVVHLALGSDVDKLVKAKLVSEDWTSRSTNQGIVAETVAAIVTREGNPKGIKSFADLVRQDVKWVTPNPKTSG